MANLNYICMLEKILVACKNIGMNVSVAPAKAIVRLISSFVGSIGGQPRNVSVKFILNLKL